MVAWAEATENPQREELARFSRSKLVLLLVPAADIFSFEMARPAHSGISVREIVYLNFGAFSPFPADAVHLLCHEQQSESPRIVVDYVARARINPFLNVMAENGLVCDGFLLGGADVEPLLIDWKSQVRKRLVAHARPIALAAFLLSAGLVVSALLGRLEGHIAAAEKTNATQVAELRKLALPGSHLIVGMMNRSGEPLQHLAGTIALVTTLLSDEDAILSLETDGAAILIGAPAETLIRIRKRTGERGDIVVEEAEPDNNKVGRVRIRPKAVAP